VGGGIGGNVGALAAARQRWGFVGVSVAACQGAFAGWHWGGRIGRAVFLG
jgi:hypothetical protein